MQERKIIMTQARTFTRGRDYHPYILQVLKDAAGEPVHITDIHAKTRELMRDVLLPGDDAPTLKGQNGELKGRFGYYVSWALTTLKHEKKIRHGAERGMWELMN
jgi:hypothetical protein